MKIRSDFVTNSSSSSYIICFARIADDGKANKIIEKYKLRVYDVDGVNAEKRWTGDLGADWCGAVIYSTDDVLSEHPDDKYIIIEDSNEAIWNDEYDDYDFDYDFGMNDAINEITEENGFADIECAEGEGYDG